MKTLQNWTNSNTQLVIIRARQITDGPFHTYFVPELQMVFDDQTGVDGGVSSGVILKLDRRYDTVHELVMRTSMWADAMFNRVDTAVVVVDEFGTTLEILDIREEFGVELAEHELRELKRENIFAIH